VEVVWSSLTKFYGLDWAGIIFSMLGTHYLSKKRKRGFLLGMIGNLAFVGFGITAQSAANVVADGTYFILNARGWITWKASPPGEPGDGCPCPPDQPRTD